MSPPIHLVRKETIAVALALVVAALASTARAGDFYACYTRLDYHQPQEQSLLGRIPVNAAKVFAGDQADQADQVPRPPREGAIRWGPYADLVLNVATGRRVFGRAAGYLPYIETPKGRFPLQPLADCRPDTLCLSSFVRVVEDRPERIVVHWRHVPDPASVVMTEVVHEIFAITPDGKVRREVRVGTPKIEDFNDPANVTIQELNLTDDGVTELLLTKASQSDSPLAPVAGTPVRQTPARRPALGFMFDDGSAGDNSDQRINGVLKGDACIVSDPERGNVLSLDGNGDYVDCGAGPRFDVNRVLTVAAWIKVVSVDGYSLSIVSKGDSAWGLFRNRSTDRVRFACGGMDGFETWPGPIGATPVYDHCWHHVAGVCDGTKMILYVDGRQDASVGMPGDIRVNGQSVYIGANAEVGSRWWNGLIDDVRIYCRALDAEEIARLFEETK